MILQRNSKTTNSKNCNSDTGMPYSHPHVYITKYYNEEAVLKEYCAYKSRWQFNFRSAFEAKNPLDKGFIAWYNYDI